MKSKTYRYKVANEAAIVSPSDKPKARRRGPTARDILLHRTLSSKYSLSERLLILYCAATRQNPLSVNANIAIAETGLDTRTFRKAAARVKDSVEIRQLWRTF